jgi:hypothetical protein
MKSEIKLDGNEEQRDSLYVTDANNTIFVEVLAGNNLIQVKLALNLDEAVQFRTELTKAITRIKKDA